jgi:chromosomal replication initiator protein
MAGSLAHALETTSEDELRASFHNCELLLVDDLHCIADKLPAQRFLLAAIDTLLRRGVLMVVTQRQAPAATSGLLPRLASRLAGGLVVKLAPPGREARQELARRLAARHALRLTGQQIAGIASSHGDLADRVTTAGKIREAVLKLVARADTGSKTTNDLPAAGLDCRHICRVASNLVARHFGLPAAELKRPTRRKTVAEARALAMYLVRAVAGPSYSAIGKSFGGRDHTTVLHACRKVAAAVESDAALGRLVDDFALQLAAEGGR